jgi:hypothetical protein
MNHVETFKDENTGIRWYSAKDIWKALKIRIPITYILKRIKEPYKQVIERKGSGPCKEKLTYISLTGFDVMMQHSTLSNDEIFAMRKRFFCEEGVQGTVSHMIPKIENPEQYYDYFAELAYKGLLPEGFSNWGLCDEDGWTIAHMAAHWGNLPLDFDMWELVDNDGRTVAHEALEEDHIYMVISILGDKFFNWDMWDVKDNNGISPYDIFFEIDLRMNSKE